MKPQKAKHLHLEMEKKNPACIGKKYIAFEKYDGWYGYLDHGQPIMSRQQRAIPSLAELSEELNAVNAAVYGRLIFEIMVEGMPVFSDLNGYLNSLATADKAYIVVHDCIPHNKATPFEERLALARAVVYGLDHPKVKMAKMLHHGSSDIQLWKNLAIDIWDQGGEGIILKQADAPYSPGSRIASLMKIKEELTLDLHVIDLVEGEGKYEGTLGTLAVQEKSGLTHYISGMSDQERDTWWHEPELIVGKVVEVKAMKRLANGNLREPRFKAVRFDKGIGDID